MQQLHLTAQRPPDSVPHPAASAAGRPSPPEKENLPRHSVDSHGNKPAVHAKPGLRVRPQPQTGEHLTPPHVQHGDRGILINLGMGISLVRGGILQGSSVPDLVYRTRHVPHATQILPILKEI